MRADIPAVVLFRALGFVADREVLEHIVYDTSGGETEDTALMDMLKPSLEEAFVIQDRMVALDYIGKRGSVVGATREKRLKYVTASHAPFPSVWAGRAAKAKHRRAVWLCSSHSCVRVPAET